MASATERPNGVYDPLPTDGDPHESVDAARGPLAPDGFALSDRPLDESGKPGDIGEGEGKILHPGDTDYEPTMRHEQVKRWYASAPDGTVLESYIERVSNTGGHFTAGQRRTETRSEP